MYICIYVYTYIYIYINVGLHREPPRPRAPASAPRGLPRRGAGGRRPTTKTYVLLQMLLFYLNA